jgi:roadblock/LC7 domain-containing protein
MYSGGDWTVMMRGDRCVFIETAKADFNHLHRLMVVESVSRQKIAPMA